MASYKPNKQAFEPADHYEKQLIKDMENDEFVEVPNQKVEIKKYVNYFKNMPKKDKRVTIRLDKSDIENIREKAIETGIPYQTLIASILHKFAKGKINIGV